MVFDRAKSDLTECSILETRGIGVSADSGALPKGKRKRWFAYYNQATGCWSVFYFRYGGTVEEFRDELETLTRQKLIVEINARNFEYSVFGYGFRKSLMVTGTSMDDVWLTIADARNEDRPLN